MTFKFKKLSVVAAAVLVGLSVGSVRADPITSSGFTSDDNLTHGTPLFTLTGSYVKAVELNGPSNPTPAIGNPDSDFIAGTALSAFNHVGTFAAQVENYAPPSPNNPGPAFTDTAGDFNDTAGVRTYIPLADTSAVVGTGFSFTYAAQASITALNVYVGGYDATADLTATTGSGPIDLGSASFGSDEGHYGFYEVVVPADTAVTFDYLATSAGGQSDLPNVSIFAVEAPGVNPQVSTAVPLPASAGVGFSMLAGVGLLSVLRRELTSKSRIV